MKLSKITILLVLGLSSLMSFAQEDLTVGVVKHEDSIEEGLTLFAPLSFGSTFLIDNCGRVVNQWESKFPAGMVGYLREDGSLVRAARIQAEFSAGGSGGRVEIFNWEGNLIWSHNFSSENKHSHHDLAILPNGNFLIVLWDKHTFQEAVDRGRNPASAPSSGFFWSENIQEIKPVDQDSAAVVWEWNSWDHLIQDFDSTLVNYGVIKNYPERININFPDNFNDQDWFHVNSIDYNPQLDQILFSARNTGEVMIIDHSTSTEEAANSAGGLAKKGGDILYRWGNPRAYDSGTLDDRKFFGQHDASWIPEGYPGEGNITVFNNDVFSGSNSATSNILAIKPSLTGFNYNLSDDGYFLPNDFELIYPPKPDPELYSGRLSGARKQKNGNTLISLGNGGRILEVKEDSIVWDYFVPINANGPIINGSEPFGTDIFKAFKYSLDFKGFSGRDLTPRDPLEIDPAYLGCTSVDTEDILLQNITIGPNPFSQELSIFNTNGNQVDLKIRNIQGQTVSQVNSQDNKVIIPTHSWQTGIYSLQIWDHAQKRRSNIKLIKIQ